MGSIGKPVRMVVLPEEGGKPVTKSRAMCDHSPLGVGNGRRRPEAGELEVLLHTLGKLQHTPGHREKEKANKTNVEGTKLYDFYLGGMQTWWCVPLLEHTVFPSGQFLGQVPVAGRP